MSDWNALLIHGAGGGAWEWNRWRGVLDAHAITMRTIELQPAVNGVGATSLQNYVSQTRIALQALPEPRVAMGASLGGLLAASCADEVDALVLINPLPPAPWHRELPHRAWQQVVGWQRHARLPSTRQAMPDADEASAMWAFRHWRDESGQALEEAYAGVEIERPWCPVLFIASTHDEDVPPRIIPEWARAWRAEHMETLAGSHVGPLVGRHAQSIAAQTVAWLNRLGRNR